MLTKPKKSLGQNFLIDNNILQKIVNIVPINKNDEILEIGPGTGNLTDYLVKKNPKKIFVVEKDSNLSSLLAEKFKNKINNFYNHIIFPSEVGNNYFWRKIQKSLSLPYLQNWKAKN